MDDIVTAKALVEEAVKAQTAAIHKCVPTETQAYMDEKLLAYKNIWSYWTMDADKKVVWLKNVLA